MVGLLSWGHPAKGPTVDRNNQMRAPVSLKRSNSSRGAEGEVGVSTGPRGPCSAYSRSQKVGTWQSSNPKIELRRKTSINHPKSMFQLFGVYCRFKEEPAGPQWRGRDHFNQALAALSKTSVGVPRVSSMREAVVTHKSRRSASVLWHVRPICCKDLRPAVYTCIHMHMYICA